MVAFHVQTLQICRWIMVSCLMLYSSDAANFLGISIVGQSNKAGDGGIYVGSIMKGFVQLVKTFYLSFNSFPNMLFQ